MTPVQRVDRRIQCDVQRVAGVEVSGAQDQRGDCERIGRYGAGKALRFHSGGAGFNPEDE